MRTALVIGILILLGLGVHALNSTRVSDTGIISGHVSLGPTCPVMRNPPDPGCADKPYAVAISVYKKGSANITKMIRSDASGNFSIVLPYGSYTLRSTKEAALPRCADVDVDLHASSTNADISCDTGIR